MPPATRDAPDVSHTAEVDIEPRAVTAIEDGAFGAVCALVTDSDLSWTAPTSVNLDDRWQGRRSPVSIVGSAK